MQQSRIAGHRLLKVIGLLTIPFALSPVVAADGASADGLDPEIADAFGIETGRVVSIEIDHTPGLPVSVVVPIDGSDYTLDLVPYSIRADDFVVNVQLPDGSYEQHQPAPPRTVRGNIRELEGGVVTGSVLRDGLTAQIEMPDGAVSWIAPVASKLSGRDPDLHIVYQADCSGEDGGACGVSDASLATISDVGSQPADFSSSGATYFAELALDSDFEYFTRWGPDPDDVVARMELVIAIVNVQYERDVDIVHIITAAFVRTSEPDPYSSTNPATLLNQFTNRWRNFEPERSVPRDLAHLFTGKDLDGGVIGIAWLKSVCTSFGFSLVQSDYSDELDCVTDLTARELGYMWGASPHSLPDWTMGSPPNCANRFHPDHTIPDIVEFRNSRLCLDVVSEICIVHGNPDWDRDDPETWVSFNEWAFGGYIDPKVESTNGVDLDLGLNTFNVVFTLEPFGDPVGGPVTPANIAVEVTGGAVPSVVSVTKDGFKLTVELDRIITLQEWTTLVFMVYSGDGVQIVDDGNQGEGVGECARLDVGFLPSDVNNDGAGQPLDLSRWLSSWNGGNPIFPPDVGRGDPPDYLDIDGNGFIQPRDLNFLIRALKGDPPFTRNWRNVGMNNPQP